MSEELDQARVRLSRWPYFYVMLRESAATPASRALSERLSRPRPGSTTPDAPGANDAMDLLVTTALLWAQYAAAMRMEHLPTTAQYGREAVRFQHSVEFLHDHADRLMESSLEADFARSVKIATFAAKRVLHENDVVHKLPAPCNICHQRGLIRHNGGDVVKCLHCAATWPITQFEFLCRVLVSEVQSGTTHP
jgi:hypothetical protein